MSTGFFAYSAKGYGRKTFSSSNALKTIRIGNSDKNSLLCNKRISIHARSEQNQCLWRHFGIITYQGNLTFCRSRDWRRFRVTCHSFIASVCGGFARHSSARSGLSHIRLRFSCSGRPGTSSWSRSNSVTPRGRQLAICMPTLASRIGKIGSSGCISSPLWPPSPQTGAARER